MDSIDRHSAPAAGLDESAVYQALVARRISYDQMMWQVPALSMAAQAFLIATGVDGDTPVFVASSP